MRPRYAATEEKFLAGKEREKRGGRGLFAVAAAFDARSFHLETLGGVRLEMRANRGCCDSASTYREEVGELSRHQKNASSPPPCQHHYQNILIHQFSIHRMKS